MMGERMAGGVASFGQNVAAPAAMGAASLFGAAGSMGMMGTAGKMAGMLDPMSMMMRGGSMGSAMMGGGAMGMVGGMMGAGAVAAPLYAGAKAVGAYADAFSGGMQDQSALNSNLRQNFNFAGGRQGRGFNQQQMGAVGGVIQQELNRNVFSNAGEMNQLVSGGAQAGMFTGVRDVSAFATKFRQMLDTLKAVQTELGGTLTEALQFVNESKQAGIFQQMDRSQFATQIRNVTQVTGMSRQDAMSMAVQGASIARQTGGVGAQGAMGATKMATTMGTALNEGIVSQEMLSEATGGATGTQAIQQFTTNMMQRTGRFLKRPGMGRYATFALAGEDGNLDEGMFNRFLTGDISTGSVGNAARRNVRSMGRAEAINRSGEIRGSIMERGGMAGQIGMMKLMLGDRVMQGGDHLSSLVMQRRFKMSRPEADIMQTLMRNQGQIAQTENIERGIGRRSAEREQDIAQNRSFDAVSKHIGHGLKEGLGINKVRQMGRRFITGLSSQVQDVMDDMLGIVRDEMSRGSAMAMERASIGRATAGDIRRLDALQQIGGGGGGGGGDPFEQGILERFGPDRGRGRQLESAGFDISGRGGGRRGRIIREAVGSSIPLDEQRERASVAEAAMRDARAGIATGPRARRQLQEMLADRQGTQTKIRRARMLARGREGGVEADFSNDMSEDGMEPTAVAAFMARTGMAESEGLTEDSQAGSGAAGRGARNIARGVVMGAATMLTMGVGGIALYAAGAAAESMGLTDTNIMAMEEAPGVAARDTAAEYFMGGGALGEAGRHAKENRGYAQRLAGHGDDIIARGQAAQIGSRETIDAIFDGVEMQDVAFAMMEGGDSATAALGRLQDMATAEQDPTRRQALESMAESATQEIRDTGKVGEQWGRMAFTDRVAQEATQSEGRRLGVARNYGAVAGALGQLENNSMAAILADDMSSLGAAFRDSTGSGNATAQTLITDLAALDEGSVNDIQGALGQVITGEGREEVREQARGFSMALGQQRATREALIGRGRRGRRQSLETAMGVAGGLGRNLEIKMGEGDDQRSIRGQRSERMVERFLRGGRGMGREQREAVRQALSLQMETGGLGEDQQQELQEALEGVARGGSREDRSAAADVMMGLQKNPAFRRTFEELNKQQTDQAMAAAGRRDPMGQQRNDLLTRILAAPGVSNAPNGEQVPPANGGVADGPDQNMSRG